MDNIIDILEARGFIEATTSNEMQSVAARPLKVYCGFDPTADSLHLGNMVALMGLAWFQKLGHIPVALIGGATGMVGDPSGKSVERPLLDEPTIQANIQGIKKNLEKFLDFNHPTAKPVIFNNSDWFKNFTFIDFLRDVGKHFRLGPMLARDSVKTRLNSPEGMSFTEFSYQILQGYDFLYLFQHAGVTVQLGGSDQWGNIVGGTELIRKVTGGSAYGITFPLLTRSDGQKFGKSEKGAVWLSPEKLSPYEFYQYLVRVADADVIRLMKMLTFMNIQEINGYEVQMGQPGYVPNTAQKRLAAEVTKIVHGEQQLQVALRVTESAAPGAETPLDAAALNALAGDMPTSLAKRSDMLGGRLVDWLVALGLQSSKAEARRLVQNGGVYLNNARISDANRLIDEKDLIDNSLLLLSVGKKNKLLVRLV